MTRFLLTLCLLTAIRNVSTGQTGSIDSLTRMIRNAEGEKEKLRLMLVLCDEYQNLNRDTLDLYSAQARVLAKKVGTKRDISLASIAFANDYYRWGWMDSAIAEISPTVMNSPADNPDTRDIHFKAARQLAIFYGSKTNYAKALSILYQLVNDAEKYKDTIVISTNLNTIGSISLQREPGKNAFVWLNRALGFLTEDRRFDGVRAGIYANMATAYQMMNMPDSAIRYAEKGSALFRSTNNLMNLAVALQKQSDIYIKYKKYDQAEATLKEMVAVRNQTSDGSLWVDENMSLIEFYIVSNQVDKAIAFCKEMMQTGNIYAKGTGKMYTNNLSLRLIYYRALARCYKLKGDRDNYEAMLEKVIEAKDSLNTALSDEAIAEAQTKYEVQRKENMIIQQQLTIARKTNQLYLSLSVVLAISVTGYFIFRIYKKRQKQKLSRMLENEKQLSAKAVADAEEKERKRIAADLHDNLGAYAASIASNLDIFNSEEMHEHHKTALQELNNNSQSIVSQLSDTIWALNKDNLTLTAISDRVKVFLNRIRKSHGNIDMEVIENIKQDVELQPTHAFHLFRIVQEAVTNAVKHSGMSKLRIHIEEDQPWKISIADNGKGIASTNREGGNGLKNMRARAAISGWNIKWTDNQPAGTEVIIMPA